jgi:hypothetical protein
MEASRRAIENSRNGIPAGGISHRGKTTAPKGYLVIKAKYQGMCLNCQRSIPIGRQVRYWFGHGVTCRTCILPASNISPPLDTTRSPGKDPSGQSTQPQG